MAKSQAKHARFPSFDVLRGPTDFYLVYVAINQLEMQVLPVKFASERAATKAGREYMRALARWLNNGEFW